MKTANRKDDEVEEAKILVLSHCILNRATRWWQNEKTSRKNQGPVSQVLAFLSTHKIGAVQLPCPEFTFCGNPRPPRTKDEYEDLPGFRLHCEKLAKNSAQYLKTLITMGVNQKIRVLAIVGVECSPTCGVKYTPRIIEDEAKYVEEKGLFLEILEKELMKLGLEIPFIGVNLHKPEEIIKRLNDFSKRRA